MIEKVVYGRKARRPIITADFQSSSTFDRIYITNRIDRFVFSSDNTNDGSHHASVRQLTKSRITVGAYMATRPIFMGSRIADNFNGILSVGDSGPM